MKAVEEIIPGFVLPEADRRVYKSGSLGRVPAWRGDYETVFRYKLNFWERLEVLFFGNVWIHVFAGSLAVPRIACPIQGSTMFDEETT